MAKGRTGWRAAPRAARWIGIGGLIPFAAGAVAVLLTEDASRFAAREGLAAYGAIILAFLGGCRWGFAAAGMGGGPQLWPLTAAAVPALFAWVVLPAPWPAAPVLLAVGFIALFGADVALTRRHGAPDWWPALRLPLTAGAVLSLLLASLG